VAAGSNGSKNINMQGPDGVPALAPRALPIHFFIRDFSYRMPFCPFCRTVVARAFTVCGECEENITEVEPVDPPASANDEDIEHGDLSQDSDDLESDDSLGSVSDGDSDEEGVVVLERHVHVL